VENKSWYDKSTAGTVESYACGESVRRVYSKGYVAVLVEARSSHFYK